MTNREREFAALGFGYAEGIDSARVVIVPSTGREIRRTENGWEAQPWNDNYWEEFDDLLDAAKFATRPKANDDSYTCGTCGATCDAPGTIICPACSEGNDE